MIFSLKNFFAFYFICFFINVVELKAKEIGVFKDWSAYAEGEGKNLACMAVSKPVKAQGKYKKRGDVFAVITHLPGQDKWNEFSIVAGYNFKPESNPDVVIGDFNVQLFTSGSRAWSFSPNDDEKIIKQLKSSMRMTVVGTSSRGTITTDTYSLLGFTKAFQKITETCKKN